MDRGLCRLPDTHQPTFSPLAPITLFPSVSRQSSTLLHSCCSFLERGAAKKTQSILSSVFEKSRWDEERHEQEKNFSRAGVVYLLRAVLFSS